MEKILEALDTIDSEVAIERNRIIYGRLTKIIQNTKLLFIYRNRGLNDILDRWYGDTYINYGDYTIALSSFLNNDAIVIIHNGKLLNIDDNSAMIEKVYNSVKEAEYVCLIKDGKVKDTNIVAFDDVLALLLQNRDVSAYLGARSK